MLSLMLKVFEVWVCGKQTFDQQPPEFLATFSVFSPLARKAIIRLLFDGKILRENFKEVTEVVEQDFHWNLSGQL